MTLTSTQLEPRISSPMTNYRQDPISGRQVILSTDRQGRPRDVLGPVAESPVTDPAGLATHPDCPFCAGNEHHTPQVEWAYPGDTTGGLGSEWITRVVPNKYPVFRDIEGDDLAGCHEVIIESHRHCSWMSQLDDREWLGLAKAWQGRLAHLAADGRFPMRGLFKNVGHAGGASLAHVHSQVFAAASVPRYVASGRDRQHKHHAATGECVTCATARDELAGDRVIYSDDNWLLYCPWASRQAYEMCLVPRAHQSCFASHLGTGKLVESFARLLARVLTTLERMLPGAGYNVMLVTEDPADHLHWRLEIVPRTAAFAGIELLSGVYICTVDPGVAAAQLRGAW